MNKMVDIDDAEIEALLANLDDLSPEEIAEIDQMVDELASRKANQTAYDDLLGFCKKMDPNYIVGRHHRILLICSWLSSAETKTVSVLTCHHVMVSRSSCLSSTLRGSWGVTRTRRS